MSVNADQLLKKELEGCQEDNMTLTYKEFSSLYTRRSFSIDYIFKT